MTLLLCGSYHPIEDYGAIGDGHNVALIAPNGSIDWLCWPRFDSPSVFAALLDSNKGGRFQIAPDGPYSSFQHYLNDTNVLETSFQTATGMVTLTDFMLCGTSEEGQANSDGAALFRVTRCTEGELGLHVLYQPRPSYGRESPLLLRAGEGVTATVNGEPLTLASTVPLAVHSDYAEASFSLRAGETGVFALGKIGPAAPKDWERVLRETVTFWRKWVAKCSYEGPWRKHVVRSALALKLLLFDPTGAVVAAPTTSLPEAIGGVRNWDYRYAWLRDAGMTLNALYSLGYRLEAERYADWVLRTLQGCRCDVDLKVMYTVDGGCSLAEEELGHLEGYRGSRPVRIGNAAHVQEQLDVYGEVLDCLALCRAFGRAREPGAWGAVTRLAEYVVQHWNKPDYGIWEVRSAPRHFVYSKVMAWVALERVIQAAEQFQLPGDLDRWRRAQEQIRADILEKGVGGSPPFLARAYDDPSPDAANLLIVGTGLLPANHPVLTATVEQIGGKLGRDALLYRYVGEDGLPGQEGAFLPCSFWLVEALARTGRWEKAAKLFEEVLSYSNGLGLLPEEIDPDSKEYLGNYPQGLSHVALINAALALQDKSYVEHRTTGS